MSELCVRLGEPTVYLFEPVPAPRMSKSSAWSLEPGVVRYKAFAKEVRRRGVDLPSPFVVEFHLLGKGRADGQDHLQKPDTDNLVKGLIDAVYWRKKGGDSHMCRFAASKVWSTIESHFIVWPVLGWEMRY
jgi:hypothetical protein